MTPAVDILLFTDLRLLVKGRARDDQKGVGSLQ